MVFAYLVRPEHLKSPSRQYKGNREDEKTSCSLWKTKFPVEAVFPIEIILNCHVLNMRAVVDQREATY